jgi:TetR/AcrR family transcriptional regulator
MVSSHSNTEPPELGLDHSLPPPDPSSRQRLLQAAADIFERKGYASASVREIVERAGVTKPVLYYYFGSKEGLLLAILETGARDLAAAVAAAGASPGTIRERIAGVCRAVHTLIRAKSAEMRVSHATYFSSSEHLLTFDFRQFDRTIVGELERLVRQGIESGELRPVSSTDAALAILGVLILSIDQEVLRRDDGLDEAGLDRVLNLVFDGLCRTSHGPFGK